MQRIGEIDRWTTLVPGKALEFANDKPRNVRLQVNAKTKAALNVVDHEGQVHFLALVEGLDVIEFGVRGSFMLTVGSDAGEEVNIFTADGDDISHVNVHAETFTKIVEGRRRNPELEQMMFMMNRNLEMRLEQQAYDLERSFAARMAATQAANVGTSVPSDGGAEPPPAGGGGTPAPVDGDEEGASDDEA